MPAPLCKIIMYVKQQELKKAHHSKEKVNEVEKASPPSDETKGYSFIGSISFTVKQEVNS